MDKLPHQILAHFERLTDQLHSRTELLEKLSRGQPLRVKFGIDLTAPGLHIGHAVNLWLLRDLQALGHKVVLVLGDFTTRVGDPAQKMAVRGRLTPEQIAAHEAAILEQTREILRFDDPALIEVRRNAEWYDHMPLGNFMDILRDVTHAQLISRDSFQKRIAANSDIFAHEMLYPVLQGYDSVVVKADIAVIGADQMFNEMTGRFLQEKHGQPPQSILATKITAGTDGELKQSKSLGNYIGLAHDARDKVARLMNLPDHLIAEYLRLYTDIPLEEIDRQLQEYAQNPRALKRKLAYALVGRYHGHEAAVAETERYEKMQDRNDRREMPVIPLFQARLTVLELVMLARPKLGMAGSRQLIEDGQVMVNDETYTAPDTHVMISTDDVLSIGKQEFSRLMVLQPHEFASERLLLRPMKVEDIDLFRKTLPQWEIAKYLGLSGAQKDEAVAHEVLKRIIAKPEPKDELLWSIAQKAQPRDMIGVAHLRRDASQGNHNIWLAEKHRNQGFAEEIIDAVNEYAFENFGLNSMTFKNAFGSAASPAEIEILQKRFMNKNADTRERETEEGTWTFTKDGWLLMRREDELKAGADATLAEKARRLKSGFTQQGPKKEEPAKKPPPASPDPNKPKPTIG